MGKKSSLVQWSEYLGLRAFASLLHCLDINQNLHFAASVGSLFYQMNPRRRERAEQNIRLSFPDLPPPEVSDIAERSMQHMFQLFMVDALVMPRLLTPASWPQHVRLSNVEPVIDRLMRHEPVILVTGHLGNWEVLGYTFSVAGFQTHAVARPLDNRLLNDWLLGIREGQGMKIVTKWGASPILQETLRSGGRVGFIADQNAGDHGFFVPFFGRLASSYKSIGLLAMRYEVPVIVGGGIRINGRFEYEAACEDIIHPEDWASQPDPLFYISARYSRALEQIISRHPDQYLWLHRRWKSRPPHERRGEPIPDRLVERIRQLPWMTEEELDLIVERSNAEARGGVDAITR